MTTIEFSAAAKLYAKNKDLVDRLATRFREECFGFVRDQLTPAIEVALAPRLLHVHDTGGYIYWYTAVEKGKAVPAGPSVYGLLADPGIINGEWVVSAYWPDKSASAQRAQARARAMAFGSALGDGVVVEAYGADESHLVKLRIRITDASTVDSIGSAIAEILNTISE